MNKFLIALILCVCFYSTKAQDFVGFVVENDSAETAIYQANISVKNNGKEILNTKTYYDGRYSFAVSPSNVYFVQISFAGFKDTTLKLEIDKNGKSPLYKKKTKLSKDGLRLLGQVIDRNTGDAINEAGIVLKNIMTRQEDRFLTKADGRYNLKLDYETNYLVKIDKRSPGIMNRYQDTTFYLSTVGFNLPLDFKLDISLGTSTEVVRPRQGYDPYKKPTNVITKPVVEVVGFKDSAKLSAQLKEIDNLKEQLRKKDSVLASIDNKLSKKSSPEKPTNINSTVENNAAKLKLEEEARLKLEVEKRTAAELKARKDQEVKAAEAKKLQELEQQKALLAKAADEERQRKQKIADDAARELQIRLAKEKELEDKRLAAEKAKADLERAKLAEREKLAKEKADKELLEKKLAEEAKLKEQQRIEEEKKIKAIAEEAERKKRAEALALKQKQDEEAKVKEQKRIEEEKQLKAKAEAEENRKREEALALKAKQEEAARKVYEEAMLKEKMQAEEKARLKAIADAEEKRKIEDQIKAQNAAKEKALAEERARIEKATLEEKTLKDKYMQELLVEMDRKAAAKAREEAEQQRILEDKKLKEQFERDEINRKLRALEEQERTMRAAEQQKVIKEEDEKRTVLEETQKDMIAYYEEKLKEEERKSEEEKRILASQSSQSMIRQNEKVPVVEMQIAKVLVTGEVINSITNEPISDVSVTFRKNNSIVSSEIKTDDKGKYVLEADANELYVVSFFKENFTIGKQFLDLSQNKLSTYHIPSFFMTDLNNVNIENKPTMLFSRNNSNVDPYAYSFLLELVKDMKRNANSTVTLNGLSSISETYPKELSASRCREVARFLIENGIKPNRININAWGISKSRSGCSPYNPCSEQQEIQDRVVIFDLSK